jgi:HAD superfamily hydrolase (TIGR01509 family)
VFDCDGLMIDSAVCWHRAYEKVAAELGRSLSVIDLAPLTGASVARAARHLGRELNTRVDEERLRRALGDTFAAHPPGPLPGVHALVAALGARIPLAVASNAPRDLVITVLDGLEIRAAFDAVVSAEETAADKPAPDVYLEACRRLGVAPSDAIAFEDSPVGADAARAAGLVVVGVPSRRDMRIDADLKVSSLRDQRLLEYLGLEISDASVDAAVG